MDIERNLLFGVLALQADAISRPQLMGACTLWAGRADVPLPELLVHRGWIAPADRADMERLVERKLKKHGGSARAGLREVLTDDLREALAGVADAEVRRTLAELSRSAGESPLRLLDHINPQKGAEAVSTPPAVSDPLPTDGARPAGRGRYDQIRLLSEGDVARVWLVRDLALGREVALKELRSERADNPAVRARFLDEARITGQLEHPGIVPIYELEESPEGRPPFYTMPVVEGRTLADAIRAYHLKRAAGEAEPLELRDLLGVFVELCQVAAYAHSRGVVHRDLKSQNVLLDHFGAVRVREWGLAKVDAAADEAGQLELAADQQDARDRTLLAELLGAPAAMSPEQAEGRLAEVDQRSDVYSLGAILYEILTGSPPFPGTDTREILRRVVHEPPPRPRGLAPATPPVLEAVCLRALAKRPAERYASAGELARAVQCWMASEPPAANLEALRPPSPRRPRVLPVAAVVLLLLALAASTAGLVYVAHANARIERQRVLAQRDFEEVRLRRARAEQELARVRAAETTAEEERTLAQVELAVARRRSERREQELARARSAATEAERKRALAQGQMEEARQRGEQVEQELARARSAAAAARRSAEKAEAIENFLIHDLLAAAGSERERDPHSEKVTVEELLGKAARKLNGGFAGQPEVELALRAALGETYRRLGLPLQAEPHLLKTLELRRRVSGAEDSETLAAASALAAVFQAEGKLAEAEPLYRQVLEVRRRVLGAEHPRTLTTLNNLAFLLQTERKLAEAEPLYRQVLKARRRVLGAEHPRTLAAMNNLASLLEDQGKPSEAEPLLREALGLQRKSLPAGHASIGATLSLLGWALTSTGKVEEAEPLLRESLRIRRKLLPAHHWLIANTESLLGGCLTALGRYAEAEPLLLGSYSTLKTAREVPPPRVAQALERIVQLYDAWGKPEKAAAWRTKFARREKGKNAQRYSPSLVFSAFSAPPR